MAGLQVKLQKDIFLLHDKYQEKLKMARKYYRNKKYKSA